MLKIPGVGKPLDFFTFASTIVNDKLELDIIYKKEIFTELMKIECVT